MAPIPLPIESISRDDFVYLTNNIRDQILTVEDAQSYAQSGLQYIVDKQATVGILNYSIPEIDLVNPLYSNYQVMDTMNNTSAWIPIVISINNHIVTRNSIMQGNTNAEKFNSWLADEDNLGAHPIHVNAAYAEVSEAAGYAIDAGNIAPTGPSYVS